MLVERSDSKYPGYHPIYIVPGSVPPCVSDLRPICRPPADLFYILSLPLVFQFHVHSAYLMGHTVESEGIKLDSFYPYLFGAQFV